MTRRSAPTLRPATPSRLATAPAAARHPIVQRRCACGRHTVAGGDCEPCRADRKHGRGPDRSAGHVQRSASGDGGGGGASSPPPPGAVADVLRSAGRPLDARVRADWESRFASLPGGLPPVAGSPTAVHRFGTLAVGPTDDAYERQAEHVAARLAGASPSDPGASAEALRPDLSRVRVHTGPAADRAARSVDARAFAFGHDLVFADGRYASDTADGRRLLGHELTHVLQQGGGTGGGGGAGVIRRDDFSLPKTVAGAGEFLGGLRDKICTDPAECLGKVWLTLEFDKKVVIVDWLLDHAAALTEAMPRDAMGFLWPVMRAGFLGFFRALRAADDKAKIAAVDKVALIMAGRSPEFQQAFLIGFLKGFFIEGLFGPIVAVKELIEALPALWSLLKQVEEVIDGFPDDMKNLYDGFVALGTELAGQIGPGIEELSRIATDPSQITALAGHLSGEVEQAAASAGGQVGDALLEFLSKPGADKAIGDVAGTGVGMVTFEAVAAAVTAGGSTAVTAGKLAVKEAAGFLRRIAAKVAGSFLSIFREVVGYIGKAVDVVKGAAKLLKEKALKVLSGVAERVGGMFDEVIAFFKKLLGHCHESKLTCLLPGKSSAPKAAAKAKARGKAILEIFEEGQGKASTAAREADVLSHPDIRAVDKPGGTKVPEHFEIGNFSHHYAEDLIPESQLPRGLDREYKIPGADRRVDRIDHAGGWVYEVKPDTQIRNGQRQVKLYVDWLNANKPLGDGRKWQGKVVTYNKATVKALLKKIGWLE